MKTASLYILPAILLVAFMSCSSPDNPGENPVIDEDLLDVVWKADTIHTPWQTPFTIIVLESDTVMTLQFYEDMKISINDGCRYYTSSSYSINQKGLLTVTVGAAEMIACGSRRLEQIANLYITALMNVTRYAISENQLTLYDSNSQHIVNFSIGIADERLIGLSAKVDSLQTPDEKIIPPSGVNMTIGFHKRLQYYGHTGCREYEGTYKNSALGVLEITSLHLSPDIDCDADKESIENAFLQALERVVTYYLDEKRLTLIDSYNQYMISFSIE